MHKREIEILRIDYQGMWDSFTALLALLIARARSVGNVAYLMFSFNDNSDYEENKSGTKHPFAPFSCSPSRAVYMHATISVVPGMIEVEPTIGWLPNLSPQSIGSALSDHYLDGRVARPLNGQPHEPFPDHR